jgi:tetratricopeptide (TPR) repeat protein
MMRATLENNRPTLNKFNVLFFDVGNSYWKQDYVENTNANVEELIADCQQITLEGATDLSSAIKRIADSAWTTANGQTPDLFLLSDGGVTWGETDPRIIGHQLSEIENLGSLFAYQTGLTGTAIANLRYLANTTGGAVFSIADEREIQAASTAHQVKPWQLVNAKMEGASDILTAGRTVWVYPGQSLMFVGRGEPSGDLELTFRRGKKEHRLEVKPEKVASELARRMYGQVAVGQLESLGNAVNDVATAYAREFRITGRSCSLLMLETEAEYQRFAIESEEDLFVVQSKNANELVAATLRKSAVELVDPKARMLGWIQSLESTPGMGFRIPTALELVFDDVDFDVPLESLQIDNRFPKLPQAYREALRETELNYDVIDVESKRRASISVDEAIKVLSSLVEENPGDFVIARDVAFAAMQFKRPMQAYPLLLKVAKARPYEPNAYLAIADCLSRAGHGDLAIVFFEIAMTGKFENQGEDFRKIVAAHYLQLLSRIESDRIPSNLTAFATARKKSLHETLGFESADLLITLQWNTDQTDVDLHVREPSGEECSYENTQTRIGGRITSDVTTGFGPEMYYLQKAKAGKYRIDVELFGNQQSRTRLRSKVYLNIYTNYGKPDERVKRRSIILGDVGNKEEVGTVGID